MHVYNHHHNHNLEVFYPLQSSPVPLKGNLLQLWLLTITNLCSALLALSFAACHGNGIIYYIAFGDLCVAFIFSLDL